MYIAKYRGTHLIRSQIALNVGFDYRMHEAIGLIRRVYTRFLL